MTIGRFNCGIGVLVWDREEDEYLLLKRSEQKDFAAGMWECVTGRVDQGESFSDAAKREVFEELNVGVELLQILGTTHFYRGPKRPDYELVGVVYLGAIEPNSQLSISAEHSEYRWVSSQEARELLRVEEGSQGWLERVISRAEDFRNELSPLVMEVGRRTGFELDL